MNPASRRAFLAVAGTGAATAAIAAVAAPAHAAPAPRGATPAPTARPAGAEGAVVAHVKDVRRGVVTVMVKGRSVDVTDHELVARLAHAATAAKV